MRTAMAGVALSALMSASSVAACSFMPVIELEGDPVSLRADCRALLRDRQDVLQRLGTGTLAYSDIGGAVRALGNGTNECPQQRGTAFAFVDAALGSPVRAGAASPAVEDFLKWAPESLPELRRIEAITGSWIVSPAPTFHGGVCSATPYLADALPDGVPQERLQSLLVRPEYWAEAIRQFGNNPARDRMVLETLVDSANPEFDLREAARLLPEFHRADRTQPSRHAMRKGARTRMLVAEALADPQRGLADYEAASDALGSLTQFTAPDLDAPMRERLIRFQNRIAQSRLASDDPAIQRRAELVLRTGDPNARPGPPVKGLLPAGSTVVVLEEWPEALVMPRLGEKAMERIADSYPSRAIRTGEGGRVAIGALFDPEGTFRTFHVLQGTASSALERSALTNAERYVLSDTGTLRLSGYAGAYVLAPLAVFEYSFGDAEGEATSDTDWPPVFRITAPRLGEN